MIANARPASCHRCQEPLPPGALFCPACGLRTEGGTGVLDTPPDEVGPVPVHLMSVSRFPPALVGGKQALTRLRRALRARSAPRVEALSIRLRTRRAFGRLQYELAQLVAERRRLLVELGEAVCTEDPERSEQALIALRELDEQIAAREHEQREIATWADSRLKQAYLETQPTEVAPREPEPS